MKRDAYVNRLLSIGLGVGVALLALGSSANAYVVSYSPGLSGPLGSEITFDGLPAVTPPDTCLLYTSDAADE